MPDGHFVGACYRCKVEVWLPASLYDACKRSSKHSFFCSYGHEQIFAEGETEAQILRRDRDRLAQKIAQKDDEIRLANDRVKAAEYQVRSYKGVATRTLKRAKAGTCPCCHRTFRQMALHMANKHPDFKAEEAA